MQTESDLPKQSGGVAARLAHLSGNSGKAASSEATAGRKGYRKAGTAFTAL
jgi:hypothetical protein